MSYTDDEEEKIGGLDIEDDDLDLDMSIDDPLDDDLLSEDDGEELDEFADLDGSSY